MPGGIAELLDFANRKPLESGRAIVPRPDACSPSCWPRRRRADRSRCRGVALSFGGVHAIDGLDLDRPAGRRCTG